ncbi:MAG: hypothetical protein ABI597_10265, partial [Gammaproteobacteria bacterium]
FFDREGEHIGSPLQKQKSLQQQPSYRGLSAVSSQLGVCFELVKAHRHCISVMPDDRDLQRG